MATQSLPLSGDPPKTYSVKEVIPIIRERSTLPDEISLIAGSKLSSSVEVARAFRQLKAWEREVFAVLLLNGKNRIDAMSIISVGTLTASLVHPREVFRPAILLGASGIVAVHNHPSGDPKPSQEDLQITRRLVEVGKLIGIRVLDHVIIGQGCHFSFADEGLI